MWLMVFAVIAAGVLIIGFLFWFGIQHEQVHSPNPTLMVSGVSYATSEFVARMPPTPLNCSASWPGASTLYDLELGGVHFEVQTFWNCTAVQMIYFLGAESSGVQYSFTFTSLPSLGVREIWISRDQALGFEVWNSSNTVLMEGILARA